MKNNRVYLSDMKEIIEPNAVHTIHVNYSEKKEEQIVSKGERLGVLLNKADELHEQMDQIFLKQGLTTPDLSLLSPRDKEEWDRLYEQPRKYQMKFAN